MHSGVMIHRELDFRTQVRVLASTSIQLDTSATKKKPKKQNHGRRFEWTKIETLTTMCNHFGPIVFIN